MQLCFLFWAPTKGHWGDAAFSPSSTSVAEWQGAEGQQQIHLTEINSAPLVWTIADCRKHGSSLSAFNGILWSLWDWFSDRRRFGCLLVSRTTKGTDTVRYESVGVWWLLKLAKKSWHTILFQCATYRVFILKKLHAVSNGAEKWVGFGFKNKSSGTSLGTFWEPAVRKLLVSAKKQYANLNFYTFNCVRTKQTR